MTAVVTRMTLAPGVTIEDARVYMTQAPNAEGVWHGIMEGKLDVHEDGSTLSGTELAAGKREKLVQAKFTINEKEQGSFDMNDVILGVDFNFITGSNREPTFSVVGASRAVVPCTDAIVVEAVAKMKTKLLKFDNVAVILTFPCGGNGADATPPPQGGKGADLAGAARAFTAKGSAESLFLHAAGVELKNVAVEFSAVRGDGEDGEMVYFGTLTSAKPKTTNAGELVWSGTLEFKISSSGGLTLTNSAGATYKDDSFELSADGEMFMVGRCRLTVSKPVFEAPMLSALETII